MVEFLLGAGCCEYFGMSQCGKLNGSHPGSTGCRLDKYPVSGRDSGKLENMIHGHKNDGECTGRLMGHIFRFSHHQPLVRGDKGTVTPQGRAGKGDHFVPHAHPAHRSASLHHCSGHLGPRRKRIRRHVGI